eukprot:8243821-Ditylum_brightwellii.AAC.1
MEGKNAGSINKLQHAPPAEGLVPAANVMRDCDFSSTLVKEAARYKHMSPSKASSDELLADCVVHGAQ